MWALLAQTSVLTPGLGPFLRPTLPEKLQTPHLEKPPTQSRTPLQRTAPPSPEPWPGCRRRWREQQPRGPPHTAQHPHRAPPTAGST